METEIEWERGIRREGEAGRRNLGTKRGERGKSTHIITDKEGAPALI